MSKKIPCTTILFIVLTSRFVFAQYSIKGRILNQADTKPLAYVSVFFAGTTIGDKTTADGTFWLKGVKQGKYDLTISILGFDTYHQQLMVDSNINLGDITLYPKVTNLNAVVVKAEKHRDYDMTVFTAEFLGTSDFANECKILNPDVLNLKYDDLTDILTGSTSDYLVIENDALGYTVKYQVDDFVVNDKNPQRREVAYQGSVFFEEMKGTPAVERVWARRRNKVYQNSSMHFFRAVLENDIPESGFEVLDLEADKNYARPPDSLIDVKLKFFKKASHNDPALKDSLSYWQNAESTPRLLKTYVPKPLLKYDMFKPTNIKGIYALFSGKHNEGLEVFYDKDSHFTQHFDRESTLLNFKKTYAFFDTNGVVINPADVLITGAWGNNRVAELLPLDYEPPEKQ